MNRMVLHPRRGDGGSGYGRALDRTAAWRFDGVLIAGLFCLAVTLILVFRAAASTWPARAAASPDALPVTVSVARVHREDLSRTLSLIAEFHPFLEIDVHAKVAGFLKSIPVDLGDRVTQGQLLAELEIPEQLEDLQVAEANTRRYEDELAEAESGLARTAAAHESVHLNYLRMSSVSQARPKLLAQQEVDDARGKDGVTAAQVSSARSSIAAARHQLGSSRANEQRMRTLMSYARITAPFEGVITRRYAHPGVLIQQGTTSQAQTLPIVRLSQVDLLRLVVAIPESDAPHVRVGSPVRVRVPAIQLEFPAQVARIAYRLEVATRTMTIEIDVKNPQLRMMPGMYAYADIEVERRAATLALPITAVSSKEGKSTVMKLTKESKLEETPVTLGIETPTSVEIVSGLAEGDRVVLGSLGLLTPGQSATPAAEKPGAAEGH